MFSHNLTSFDSHLIGKPREERKDKLDRRLFFPFISLFVSVQAVASDLKHISQVTRVVARNSEKFLSISLRFRCQFCISHLPPSSLRIRESRLIEGEEEEEEDNNRGDGEEENEESVDHPGIFSDIDDESDDDNRDNGDKVAAIGSNSLVDDNDTDADVNATTDAHCSCHKIQEIHFLDSFAHLPASLEAIVASLKTKAKPFECSACDNLLASEAFNVSGNSQATECDECKVKKPFDRVFPRTMRFIDASYGRCHAPLLLGKLLFPYSYIKDYATLEETSLPPKSAYFNKLTQSPISDEQYESVQRLWNQLDLPNLRSYYALYLSLDIYHLLDTLAGYQNLCINYYEIDPLSHLTLPSVTLQAAMKWTGVSLDLISDPTLSLFFENFKRGGLSYCASRYAKSNAKHIVGYDPSKPEVNIGFYDYTNLYGT